MKTKHFKSRHALLMSLTSLMLCVSMLFGATFAWFTDSVESGVNRIISGNLDVEITHQTAGMTAAESVSQTTRLFTKDMNGKDLLWEPEVMAYETFTVSNAGTLNLKYQMNVNKVGENNLNNHVLADVIRVAVVDSNTVTRNASLFANAPTLAEFVQNPVSLANFTNATGSINAGAAAQSFTIMLYWPEDGSTYALTGQNDNDYNVNNTSEASDSLKYLWVELGITLLATQETGEYDSFNDTYDELAEQPNDGWSGVNTASMIKASASSAVVTADANTGSATNQTYAAQETTVMDAATNVSAKVPASALASYAKTVVTDTVGETTTTTTTETELDLKVTPTSASNAVLTAATGDSSTSLYYDIDMTAITTKTVAVNDIVDAGQTKTTSEAVTATDALIEVTLPIGENLDLQGIYHKTDELGEGMANKNKNGEYYTYSNGILTLYVKTFSPFSIAYKFAGGLGTEAAPYLIANREQMQAIGSYFYEEDAHTYDYYKVADEISEIDCSDWTPVYINGSFDGNGVTFRNVDNTLFGSVTNNNWDILDTVTFKSFNVETNIHKTSWISGVIRTAAVKNVNIENVNVFGTIEGSTGVASYVCFGPGNYAGEERGWVDESHFTFKNCSSTATLISTSGNAVGFIAHPMATNNSSVSLVNSSYSGEMQLTNAVAKYVIGNWYNGVITDNSGDATKPYNSSKNGWTYTDTLKITSASAENIDVASLNIEKGQTYSVAAVSGATNADIAMIVSPGPGCFTATWESETVSKADGKFTSSGIKYWEIRVNASGATQSGPAENNIYNIVSSAYQQQLDSNTIIRIVQKDNDGKILKVTNINLGDKTANQ